MLGDRHFWQLASRQTLGSSVSIPVSSQPLSYSDQFCRFWPASLFWSRTCRNSAIYFELWLCWLSQLDIFWSIYYGWPQIYSWNECYWKVYHSQVCLSAPSYNSSRRISRFIVPNGNYLLFLVNDIMVFSMIIHGLGHFP